MNVVLSAVLFLFAAVMLYGQTDWERWEKRQVPYQKTVNKAPAGDESNISTAAEVSAGLFVSAYRNLFSNYDGDNCPFHPSCSEFLRISVTKTDPFTALLMFADRFTRDMNFIDRADNYPFHVSGKYYDPVELYINEEIQYLPPAASSK